MAPVARSRIALAPVGLLRQACPCWPGALGGTGRIEEERFLFSTRFPALAEGRSAERPPGVADMV